MILVTEVMLANGYRLNPDNERDAPLLDAAARAADGQRIHTGLIGILRGTKVTTYSVRSGETALLRLQ